MSDLRFLEVRCPETWLTQIMGQDRFFHFDRRHIASTVTLIQQLSFGNSASISNTECSQTAQTFNSSADVKKFA